MDPSDFYTGIVPEVYGALRGTHFEAGRYAAFVSRHGTPALELGCGDDGPFYELVAAGLDVTGVDSSRDMVHRGRERLATRRLDAVVHHQRMEELTLDQRFSSIYLAGPTFNLLPDDRTGLRALRAVAAHLRPGGAVLVPLWTPPPTPAVEVGVTRTATTDAGESRFTVLSETYDVADRTRTTRVRYELVRGAESTEEVRDWVIHWYTADGFRELAADAGLEASFAQVDDESVEATLSHLTR